MDRAKADTASYQPGIASTVFPVTLFQEGLDDDFPTPWKFKSELEGFEQL